MRTALEDFLSRRAHVTWRLSLLGGFELLAHDVPLPLAVNEQRLVAFLALRTASSRAETAGMLWSDVTECRADGSLRTTLWRLHKKCPTLLVGEHAELRLDPSADVDVRRLSAQANRLFTAPASLALDDLLGCVTVEELLPGWYDDWVLLERERMRQTCLHLLEGLAEELLDRELPAAALAVALAALRAEPLRESAHRLVIRIHLAEGNLAEAIRQYDACCALLRDELHVEPSRRLRTLLSHVVLLKPATPAERTAVHASGQEPASRGAVTGASPSRRHPADARVPLR